MPIFLPSSAHSFAKTASSSVAFEISTIMIIAKYSPKIVWEISSMFAFFSERNALIFAMMPFLSLPVTCLLYTSNHSEIVGSDNLYRKELDLLDRSRRTADIDIVPRLKGLGKNEQYPVGKAGSVSYTHLRGFTLRFQECFCSFVCNLIMFIQFYRCV